jgi:hypothetical protein
MASDDLMKDLLGCSSFWWDISLNSERITRMIKNKGKSTSLIFALAILTVLSAPLSTSAAQRPATQRVMTSSCAAASTPIKKIPGFRFISKSCGESPYRESIFVFVSTRKFNPENSPSVAVNYFKKIKQSITNRWTWNASEFGGRQLPTSRSLTSGDQNCLDTYSDCQLFVERLVTAKQEVSSGLVTTSWKMANCWGPGHYSCNFNLEVTVSGYQQFWESF